MHDKSRGSLSKQVADVAATGRDEREEQHNSIRARRGGSREEGSQQRGRNRADATCKRRAAERGRRSSPSMLLPVTYSRNA